MRRRCDEKADLWVCNPPPSIAPQVPEHWHEYLLQASSARGAAERYIQVLTVEPKGPRVRNVPFDVFTIDVRPHWDDEDTRHANEPWVEYMVRCAQRLAREASAEELRCRRVDGTTWHWTYTGWWDRHDAFVTISFTAARLSLYTHIALTSSARPPFKRSHDQTLPVFDETDDPDEAAATLLVYLQRMLREWAGLKP